MFPTLYDLYPLFISEESCIQFLLNHAILYNRINCIDLNCDGSVTRTQKQWRCTKKSCSKKVSVLLNSFFAKSRLKCNEILLIAYLWLSKAIYSAILDTTGHSTVTVTGFMKSCHELITETLDAEDEMIGGPGIVVEIDESKFGKRKYRRGHAVEGVWVFGGIERMDEKRAFVEIAEDKTAATLLNAITRHVREGSIIYSDLWSSYVNINRDLGFEHFTVNHSENFVDPETGTHTNTIEGYWNDLKLRISPRARTKDGACGHLFEAIWRKKHEKNLSRGLIETFKVIKFTQ